MTRKVNPMQHIHMTLNRRTAQLRGAVAGPGRQRGLSLIELMVAITIALFLLGGMMTMVEGTRRTFGEQNQLSLLQDNERLAMTLITDVVQSAGYFPDPTTFTADSALPVSSPDFPAVGQAINGSTNTSDTLMVRYATLQGDGVLNCIGASNTTGGTTTPVSYENVFSVSSTTNTLVCTMNGASYDLVSGITGMKVLYGVKTDSSAAGNNIDRYLDASSMASTDWANVMTVRVTLTFVNPIANDPRQPATVSFSRVIGVMNKLGVST